MHEAEAGNPEPAPYLKAGAPLDVAPPACWALEESDKGVRPAHAVGMRVFQIADLVVPGTAMRDLGHEVVGSAQAVLRKLG